MELELLEPAVLTRVKPRDVEFFLRKALQRYSRKRGVALDVSIEFEPIEGDLIEIVARKFPGNERKRVKALRTGIVSVEANVEPVEALMYLNEPSGPLSFFRKACHHTRNYLKALARKNVIRRFVIPCELTNLALGYLVPPRFLGRKEESIRLWRDDRGFRHVFGLARISITLRITPDVS